MTDNLSPQMRDKILEMASLKFTGFIGATRGMEIVREILTANTTKDEQKPEWKTGTSDAFLDDIQQEDNE